MSNHIEHPGAYQNAIRHRMMRNSIVGKIQRLDDEAPMIRRLIEEVIEPRRLREHEAHMKRLERAAQRDGDDFERWENYKLFDLSDEGRDCTVGFILSLEWSEVDGLLFPEQLVVRYFKTKKGLSPKQWAWVEKMVEEEPQREAAAAAKKLEREQRDAASNWVGNVKERIRNVPVTVEFAKTLDGGMYGPKRIVKMRDEAGNLLVTFGTSEWLWEAEKGQQVVIDFTVKEHSEYEGAKQTVITRSKLLPPS